MHAQNSEGLSVRQLLGSLTLLVLTGTASAQSFRVDRTTYVELIRKTAIEQGVPPDLAEAVAQVETGFNPTAVGTVGEVGLMQVRPSTAAMLGFVGSTDDLAKPVENVRYGVTYLGGAWKLANGNVCRALMKYRAGHNTEVMSPLSASYCQRARTYLASLGSPLAGGSEAMISQVMPTKGGIRKVGDRLPACTRGTPACSRVYWAMHEARIRRIVAQLHAVRRSGG